jgi:putative transposase
LAKAYEKVTNCRKDLAHKITTKLVKIFDIIKIEDLNIKGMIKNHNLAFAISDVGWGMIKTFLDYKCNWYQKDLLLIDRFFPGSKTCSVCGSINENLTLADREWNCPRCGTQLDRDLNAAINIKNAVGYTVSGRGEVVRLSGKRASTKQPLRSVNRLVPEIRI